MDFVCLIMKNKTLLPHIQEHLLLFLEVGVYYFLSTNILYFIFILKHDKQHMTNSSTTMTVCMLSLSGYRPLSHCTGWKHPAYRLLPTCTHPLPFAGQWAHWGHLLKTEVTYTTPAASCRRGCSSITSDIQVSLNAEEEMLRSTGQWCQPETGCCRPLNELQLDSQAWG